MRFEPAALKDHEFPHRTLYQLRHESVMKDATFVLDVFHNTITIGSYKGQYEGLTFYNLCLDIEYAQMKWLSI